MQYLVQKQDISGEGDIGMFGIMKQEKDTLQQYNYSLPQCSATWGGAPGDVGAAASVLPTGMIPSLDHKICKVSRGTMKNQCRQMEKVLLN